MNRPTKNQAPGTDEQTTEMYWQMMKHMACILDDGGHSICLVVTINKAGNIISVYIIYLVFFFIEI